MFSPEGLWEVIHDAEACLVLTFHPPALRFDLLDQGKACLSPPE